MNKELEIWRFAAARLRRGESIVLLVVAESSGSSPGRQGFKMIVAPDEMRGSIGGGVMEIALVEQAKLRIANDGLRVTNEAVEQIHRKNAENASGMICSGKQAVVLFGLNFAHLETIEKIIFALETHQSKVLRITDSALEIEAVEAEDFDYKFERTGENEFFYAEKLGSKNKLYIIGGGHCALALSELMAKMDFHVSLFDDRSDLNTLAKNDFAHRKQTVDSYENIGEFVDGGANVYVVVMTVGYQSDEIVVRRLIGKNFKYFGVLGSEAKIKTLWRELEKSGCDKEKLARIRAPVGLKINSRTPEEIAVSIAAEIIAVKNPAR